MIDDYKTVIPCVRALIEREHDGITEVLVQTRWKPGNSPIYSDPVYSGTLELPGGKLETHYADIINELAREIKEETGLTLQSVKDNDIQTYTSDKNDKVIGFNPFYCTQQLKNGLPWISYVFVCSVKPGKLIDQDGETKNVRWVTRDDLQHTVENKPNDIFTFDLPAIIKYLQLN